MDKTEAILQAGTTRFRPVILTAITTILMNTITTTITITITGRGGPWRPIKR